jgi:Cu/Ag efflux protein CusF
MKRFIVLMVALLAMVAFAGVALAQAPAETEKSAAPATGPASEKVAPAKAKKAKAGKPKAAKSKKYAGSVAAYEAGKMISVKDEKGKEMTFEVAADAKVKGEVKEGAKVKVRYKKYGDKMIATSISGPALKKKKGTPKKATPQKQEKAG